MPLSTCARCGTLFRKVDGSVCDKCLPQDEADYESVRLAMQSHPNMEAETLAEIAGVELGSILRFLAEGRIETTAANASVVCGRCGAPAISLSKRLCEGCLQKLNSELSTQQSQIQLTNKKRVEVGGTFAKRSKSGPIKYGR